MLCFFLSFLGNRSCQTLRLDNVQELSGIQPSNNGGVDDLESFQACLAEIRTTMSKKHPSLDVVLGEIASSKQPIEEGDISQAFQSIMKEKHRALGVLQAERERKSKLHRRRDSSTSAYEHKLTEADKLQLRNEGIQLGCLLVQKTKGETQLEVTRWLQTANTWEAWRQLNLQCTTSKWSVSFQLLISIMNTSFDIQPASFLQQFHAWKEQVARYQQLVGDQLSDFINLLAVVNGLKGSVRTLVLLTSAQLQYKHPKPMMSLCLYSHHLSFNRPQMCFGNSQKLCMVSKQTTSYGSNHWPVSLRRLVCERTR